MADERTLMQDIKNVIVKHLMSKTELSTRLGNLEQGQKNLEQGQKELITRVVYLERGQKELSAKLGEVVKILKQLRLRRRGAPAAGGDAAEHLFGAQERD